MMDCSCSIDVWSEDGGYKLYKEHIRRANKEHVCDECSRTIYPGEKYEYFEGLCGESDMWLRHKTCNDCLSLRNSFFESWHNGFIWEEFKIEMDDCGWQVPEKCLAKLTPAARENVCGEIEQYWEVLDEGE